MCGCVTTVTSETKSKTDSLLWFNFCDPTNLVFSETGHWVVGAGTAIIGASVDGLPRVMNFLVIPQMILASKCSMTDITEKSLCLTVDQNVPLQLKFWCELLVAIWKKLDQGLFYAICRPTCNLALKWSFTGVGVFMLSGMEMLWNHHNFLKYSYKWNEDSILKEDYCAIFLHFGAVCKKSMWHGTFMLGTLYDAIRPHTLAATVFNDFQLFGCEIHTVNAICKTVQTVRAAISGGASKMCNLYKSDAMLVSPIGPRNLTVSYFAGNQRLALYF